MNVLPVDIFKLIPSMVIACSLFFKSGKHRWCVDESLAKLNIKRLVNANIVSLELRRTSNWYRKGEAPSPDT